MTDVLVVGGGPVGLAAAIGARQAGLDVALLEPRRGVLDKACGEGLMPGALGELERLGVSVAISQSFVGIRYVEPGRSVAARLRAPGAGVRRTELHRALSERARAVGVRRLEGRAGPVRQDEAGVETAGQRARWLLGADGLHSPLRRRLGVERSSWRTPRLGVRRHFRQAPWIDHVEVHLARDAEAYVTPVAPDEIGVALLYRGPRGRRFEDVLAAFPTLRGRLGAPCSGERGAGPFARPARRRRVGRALLIGDAAGYLDPLTGEGLHLGLASARLAVDAIGGGRPERYEWAWRRRALAPWLLTDLLLRVRHSRVFAPLLIPALRASPALFALGLRLLAGDRARAAVAP